MPVRANDRKFVRATNESLVDHISIFTVIGGKSWHDIHLLLHSANCSAKKNYSKSETDSSALQIFSCLSRKHKLLTMTSALRLLALLLRLSISRALNCTPPFSDILGVCLHLPTHKTSWCDAQAYCSSISGELVRGSNYLPLAGNTCLLYTSPSPRDLSTSRMPSSA